MKNRSLIFVAITALCLSFFLGAALAPFQVISLWRQRKHVATCVLPLSSAILKFQNAEGRLPSDLEEVIDWSKRGGYSVYIDCGELPIYRRSANSFLLYWVRPKADIQDYFVVMVDGDRVYSDEIINTFFGAVIENGGDQEAQLPLVQ